MPLLVGANGSTMTTTTSRTLWAVLAIAAFAVTIATAKPHSGDLAFANTYLRQYGYIDSNDIDSTDSGVTRQALLLLQNSFGLEATGILDDSTRKLMSQARCGMPDDSMNRPTQNIHRFSRIARYGIVDKQHLTFYIGSMNNHTIGLTRLAFDFWNRETSFEFTEVNDIKIADLGVSLHYRDHTKTVIWYGQTQEIPCWPFGTRTLAHAIFPLPGHVHLNRNSNWDVNDYVNVLIHEIGHVIGMNHVNVERSIMYPLNPPYHRTKVLDEFDRATLLEMYPEWGKRKSVTAAPITTTTTAPVTTTTIATTTRRVPSDWFYARVFMLLDDELFLFDGTRIWTSKHPKVVDISERFHSFDFDAKLDRVMSAGQTPTGEVFLITPTHYLVFDRDLKFIDRQHLESERVHRGTKQLVGLAEYLIQGFPITEKVYKYDWRRPKFERVVDVVAVNAA